MSRNINRIHHEVKTYGYKPIKMTYYNINSDYFITTEKIKILIKQHKECAANKNDCKKKKPLMIKKFFGKYIVYKNND